MINPDQSPVDSYYMVFDAYCKLAELPGMLNNHPLAVHFGLLLRLATAADPSFQDEEE